MRYQQPDSSEQASHPDNTHVMSSLFLAVHWLMLSQGAEGGGLTGCAEGTDETCRNEQGGHRDTKQFEMRMETRLLQLQARLEQNLGTAHEDKTLPGARKSAVQAFRV